MIMGPIRGSDAVKWRDQLRNRAVSMSKTIRVALAIFLLGVAISSNAQASDLVSETFETSGPAEAPLVPDVTDKRGGKWAATVYGGLVSENKFSRLLLTPWDAEVDGGTPWLGLSVSRRMWTWGEDIAFELEGGAGYRFGDEKTGEAWGALYMRYDGFIWNDSLYTTIAASTGLNYATRVSPFERNKRDGGARLLHFFAPEVTVADPDDKSLEFVVRLHHRSGVFGLFNGVSSGTNIVTLGLRKRFESW